MPTLLPYLRQGRLRGAQETRSPDKPWKPDSVRTERVRDADETKPRVSTSQLCSRVRSPISAAEEEDPRSLQSGRSRWETPGLHRPKSPLQERRLLSPVIEAKPQLPARTTPVPPSRPRNPAPTGPRPARDPGVRRPAPAKRPQSPCPRTHASPRTPVSRTQTEPEHLPLSATLHGGKGAGAVPSLPEGPTASLNLPGSRSFAFPGAGGRRGGGGEGDDERRGGRSRAGSANAGTAHLLEPQSIFALLIGRGPAVAASFRPPLPGRPCGGPSLATAWGC